METLHRLQRSTAKLYAAVDEMAMSSVLTLLDQGVSPNKWNIYGDWPLHLAVAKESIQLVKTLLSRGADVEVRAEDQCTALHLASTYGDPAMIALLL